jgi:hypothetical protein
VTLGAEKEGKSWRKAFCGLPDTAKTVFGPEFQKTGSFFVDGKVSLPKMLAIGVRNHAVICRTGEKPHGSGKKAKK